MNSIEEKLFIEVIKSGVVIASAQLTKIVKSINDKRLSVKRKKFEKKNKDENSDRIELNSNEKLHGEIFIDNKDAFKSVDKHILEIERWAHAIKFSDLSEKRSLNSVYIHLDTYLLPVKRHFSIQEKNNTLPLEDAVLKGKEHCVILGQPGAGKTTSLKKICDIIIKEQNDNNFTFPILLRFRHLDSVSGTTILDHILEIIPIQFDFLGNKDSNYNTDILKVKEETIISFLNSINPIIILDGFDELRDAKAKETILKQIQLLTRKLTNSKIVLSCRTGEFNYELEHTKTFEIAPLSNTQIELFVRKWLNDEMKALDFLTKVKNSPFSDTSIKPLSLAHLCTIYQRIGNIPEQPKTIYRKVVNLLIEEWDEQRHIVRKSAFKDFQTDQKFEFLTHLSYFLTVEFKSSTFTVTQLEYAYKRICEYHGLPENNVNLVVKELESHTGIFIESGYEKFEFVHKSIQEFLTADYLVKLPSLNSVKKNFELLGSELAIAVSISSNSSLYFIELVLNYLNNREYSNAFYQSFISRIVSENPSFRQEELVSTSALVLISNWINPQNKNFNNLSNSYIDKEEYSTFFELTKCLDIKNQRVNIFKYYKYKQSAGASQFVELIRIKIPQNHRRLPSKIYVPVEFYSEFK